MRSSGAHWERKEVRRCLLNSRRPRLKFIGSGRSPVEVQRCPLRSGAGEEEARRRRRRRRKRRKARKRGAMFKIYKPLPSPGRWGKKNVLPVPPEQTPKIRIRGMWATSNVYLTKKRLTRTVGSQHRIQRLIKTHGFAHVGHSECLLRNTRQRNVY